MSATEAITIIENEPTLMMQLKENTLLFRTLFGKNLVGIDMIGNRDSPIIHIKLKKGFPQNREREEMLLQEIVDAALKEGVCISRAKYCTGQELKVQLPSIRVCITAGLSRKEIEKCAQVIKEVIKEVIKKSMKF